MAELKGVKVGDKLAVDGFGKSLTIYIIERVTPTQAICGSIRFNLKNGKRVGSSGWSAAWARTATRDDLERDKRRRIIDTIRSRVEGAAFGQLPTETLEKIAGLVSEAGGK
jgi:hypothetical protein